MFIMWSVSYNWCSFTTWTAYCVFNYHIVRFVTVIDLSKVFCCKQSIYFLIFESIELNRVCNFKIYFICCLNKYIKVYLISELF